MSHTLRLTLDVLQREYSMSTRRLGVWIAFGLMSLPYLFSFLTEMDSEIAVAFSAGRAWGATAQLVFQFNMLMPVVAGIAIADRMVRDRRLGVEQLLNSTPLPLPAYVLGKYLGCLLSILTPVFAILMLVSGLLIGGGAPVTILPQVVVAFLAIVVPAYAFITVFSLACPLVMPVRAYQVLYTGYWFWGNCLNPGPDSIPTLNGTLLTPVGRFACVGLFNGCLWYGRSFVQYRPLDAVSNWIVLAGCVALALALLGRYLAWQRRLA